MDDFMPDDDYMLGKKERLDPRLGPEIQTVDLNVVPIHRRQENNTGKIPGIVLKGMFFALVIALLPLIQKQSPQFMHYANHSSITRSWDLIHLLFVGLAISYGLFAGRPGAVAEKDADDELAVQGTQDYVQDMFDFPSVFDDYNSGAGEVSRKNKAEAFNSIWRSEEPLHVIADDGLENVTEKPLLLPIRSLKHSLSNSKPAVVAAAQGDLNLRKSEVRRNGEIFSVESGNFEEELGNIFDIDEPTVFRSPIPWSSRPDIINIKTPLHPAPVAENLRSDNGKIEDVFTSPIRWTSRLDPNTVPPAVENKPSDDGKQKISGANPQSSVLSDKQDSKTPVPPSRPPPPPPPPPSPPTVLERQPSEKNFPTSSAQKAASSSPRSSPSPSVSPSPRARPSPSPSPSPTTRQTPRPSPSPSPRQTPRPSPTRPRSARQANENSQASPSPTQTPRPSQSPTRAYTVRQVNGNLQASSGIPLRKFSSPRPSPSPKRSRPVEMQNGSPEQQSNPIQRHNDEAGLTKKDDSVQRNMNEMSPPSPPPPPPIPAAADHPRPVKPENKAYVPSRPNSPACPTGAANGSTHENRSSQKYDPNQSNGDVSRQNRSKEVQNSASSEEIKPRRGHIHSPAPPPVPPSEDLSALKKPLENGFTHRSESRSEIRDASPDRSESTSRSRGPAFHLSQSRRNSRDIEADSIVLKQKSRDADVVPLMQSEKSSRKVPTPPPVDADVRLPDSFPRPPPRPHFMDDKQPGTSAVPSYESVGLQSKADHNNDQLINSEDVLQSKADHNNIEIINPEDVDQKADEFIAKFHEQMRLAKAQSYRERADKGQKLGMEIDPS